MIRPPELTVALNGIPVAAVTRGRVERPAEVTLTYRSDAPWPLCPSLPLQHRPHRGLAVLAFLAGLLPDATGVRNRWASDFGVPDHPVDLLAHMGLDCAGAVQFVLAGNEHRLSTSEGAHVQVSHSDIEARLRDLREGATSSSWTLPQESWSLGGAQSKFALAFVNDSWHEATGSAPTTHIFKPGIERMHHQAVVEFATMRTARALGLTTARVDLLVFGNEPSLVIERFDRVPTRTATGQAPRWTRVHQVDMCQALGIMPENKYAESGGPTARTMTALLRRTSSNPGPDVIRLSDALLFNYLAECPDGHGKNLALLISGPQVRLAPLYDLATGAPYDSAGGGTRSAIAVGNVRNFGEVHRTTIEKHAREMGLDPDERLRRVADLAENIPDAFRGALEDPAVNDIQPGLSKALWRRMSNGPGAITKRCQTVLDRLG